MFNGTYAVKVKRGRRRYQQIQEHVRYVAGSRRKEAQERHDRLVANITWLARIRKELGSAVPADETPYVDYSIFERYASELTPEQLTRALKYLKADFVPEKLYKVTWNGYRMVLEFSVLEWLLIRLAIIESAENKKKEGSIPTAYYGFLSNDDFFFDETRIRNPNGVNHTSWELVKQAKEEVKIPVHPQAPDSWWRKYFTR
jgi:hypothetical protein